MAHTPTNKVLDTVTEEAIAWFARTHSDQRTRADEDRFAQWLKQHPDHQKAYARVERGWRLAGPELMPREQEKTKRSLPRILSPVALAASIALAASSVALYLYATAPITAGTYATAAGEQRELKLADGSTITLNTRSEVSVDLNKQRRSIWLNRGEARFTVAKDATRPFTVDAGAAQVRALGTAFDVRLSAAILAVTLVEGKVEVVSAAIGKQTAASTTLAPGQRLTLDLGSGGQRVAVLQPERTGAWLRRQLIFDAVLLPEAVEEANRYLPVPIVIDDPALDEIKVSGVVTAGNLESFIGSLESSFPIAARRRADGRTALYKQKTND